MTKLKLILTTLSLLVILSTSSFFWLTSLVAAVENGHASNSQLNHISQLGLRPLLYQRLNSLTEIDKKWVNIAKALAKSDGEVSYTLAKYYLERKRYRAGELWLSQAIRLKYHQARLLLAKIHLNNHKPHQAKALLQPIENDIFALRLLIEISITAGENKLTARYTEKFKTLRLINENKEHQVFYQQLEKYSIVNSANTAKNQACPTVIAPFATSLENLNYLTSLIESPKLAPFRPYICFSPVKYISKKILNCLHAGNEAIRCDESIWKDQESLISLENRFIAILVEKGGANVNSGILYLDANDTAKVFFHELAHLLGFVDEYPLPTTHFRCLKRQGSAFSHNIAVLPRIYQGPREAVRRRILAQLPWSKYISSTTPLVSKTAQGWELGTIGGSDDTVGGFIAETCSGPNFVAVKPLNQRTAMRYFEEAFPTLYMQLLLDKPKQFLMPSYLNNVDIALEMKNNAIALF